MDSVVDEAAPAALTPAEAKKARFHNLEKMLHRFEGDFHLLCSNPHCPPEEIAQLLQTIHLLRVEKDHHRP